MSRSFVATTLVLALLSAPVAPAVRAQERAPLKETADKPQAAPPIVTGTAALKLLDGTRRELLKALQERSKRPVQVAVDRASLAILQIDLELPVGARSPGAAQEAAYGFVKTYDGLLDPAIASSDLVPAQGEACDSSAVVVFDRVVDGVAVLGSKLTLQFSAQGALVAVINGMASASREVRPGVEDDRAWEQVKQAVPPEQLEEALGKGRRVLVPQEEEGKTYLQEATLVTWHEEPLDGPPENKALLVGVQGVASGVFTGISPAGVEKKLSVAEPSYHVDPQTGLTDAISYHDVGGMPVAVIPVEILCL